MDPLKEPKDEPENGNEISQREDLRVIKDEAMKDIGKDSSVASGGMKREVSTGFASKRISQSFGDALYGINNEVKRARGKDSTVASGGMKREVSSGSANKKTDQSFGEDRRGVKNEAMRGYETVASVATGGMRREVPSAIATKNQSDGGIKSSMQDKKMAKKTDSDGGIKPSMTEKKVTKPKIQPKRRSRKKKEESSEEENEDDYDSAEESDGSESDASAKWTRARKPKPKPLANPSKCEETLAKPDADTSMLTIGAKFTEISKLVAHKKVCSATTELAGTTWKMIMQKFWDGGLIFSLEAEKKNLSADWVCPVAAEFHVCSPHSRALIHKTTRKRLFDGKVSSGSIGLLTYKDLFDKETGFVMTNDSIIAAVTFKVYPGSLKPANEVLIRAKFTEISEFTEDEMNSPPSLVDGVAWKMSVTKEQFDQYSFKLYGEKKNDIFADSWWCPVIAEFGLISQKTGEIVHIGKIKHIYDAGHGSKYLATMMKEDLFNDVNDDSILVEVLVKTFPVN